MEMVEKYPDYTLSEYCEYWRIYHQQSVSPSMMCRELQKCNLTIKKTIRSSQSGTERVQILRYEYWEKVKNLEAENLVFLDEMGVLLGLIRSHARSYSGSRAYDFSPFYRGQKVTVVGAISLTKVVGLMTLNGSMVAQAFQVFIEHFLIPNLWEGAVVVMVSAHKL